MTGYPSVEIKLVCAQAEGVLRTPACCDRTLAYNVPETSTPQAQRRAFLGALALAQDQGRAVSVPYAFNRGKKVSFCLQYDTSYLGPLVLTRPESNDQCEDTVLRKCYAFDDFMKPKVRNEHSRLLGICDPANPRLSGTHSCSKSNYIKKQE